MGGACEVGGTCEVGRPAVTGMRGLNKDSAPNEEKEVREGVSE